MKVAIYTLGCKVNQYETQAMEQTLRAKGHQVVEFSDEADAYVVNTCSVTAVSDQKSRQVIHRVQKQHPAAVVAVCGCYPQTHPEDVRKLGADLIAGTGDREGFVSLLEEAAAGKKNLEAIDKSFERLVSYFRFIRFKVASHPLCMDRWNWGHRFGRAAARRQKSSVMVRGSKLPSRRRTSGATADKVSNRSMRVWPFFRSRPQDEISMPVSTISR